MTAINVLYPIDLLRAGGDSAWMVVREADGRSIGLYPLFEWITHHQSLPPAKRRPLQKAHAASDIPVVVPAQRSLSALSGAGFKGYIADVDSDHCVVTIVNLRHTPRKGVTS